MGMRKITLLLSILLILLSTAVHSQGSGDEYLNEKLPQVVRATAQQLALAEEKDIKTLKKLFHGVKRRLLRKHTPFSSFNRMESDQEFDCVTGTLVYASILDEMGFRYTIREFNFHTLLMVHLESGDVMFESTEVTGVIKNPNEIARRLAFFRGQEDNGIRTDNQIDIDQLYGLYFFNQAARSFNERNIPEAKNYVLEASSYYPSERITGFQEILSEPQ